jgi:hypothetical protein
MSENVIVKITKIPLTVIYLIVLISVIVPLIRPLGLPIPVDPKAVEFYEVIENLPPNSKILFDPEFSPGTIRTYQSVAVRFVEQVLTNGHTLYIYSTVQMAPIVKDWIVEKAPSAKNAVYGEDWIHFGFVPGSPDIAKSSFASDIRSVFPTDYEENKPIDEFPMMQGVNTIDDFDLLFDIYTGMQTLDSNLRQWVLPSGILWVESPNQVDAASSLPYYNSGQMAAIIYSPQMYAAYEILLEFPGDQIKNLDVLSLTQTFAVFLVIIGNAAYFIEREKDMEEK